MKKITLLMLIAFTIATHGQNRLLSSINEYLSSGNWEKSYGNNYEYDNNNNLVKQTSLRWADGVWKKSALKTYSYNATNKVTQDTYEDWNPETNEVDYKGRSNYSYTNGRLTSIESQEWKNSSWINEIKFTITYNSYNLPNVLSHFYWENAQWKNEERTTFTYNANNKIISSVLEGWDGSKWVNSEKTLYSYDANSKLILSREADWDDFNGEWQANGGKNEYEWDTAGNKTSQTDYYNSQGNIQQYKQVYTYDLFAMMSSFAHPFKDKTGFDYLTEGSFPFINKLLTETTNGGNSRTVYNYNSAITLNVNSNEIASKNFTVYPNPTNATITISQEINKLEVFDIAGKRVKSFQKSSNSFDVSNLEKGVYILKGKTIEGQIINKKVVKE